MNIYTKLYPAFQIIVPLAEYRKTNCLCQKLINQKHNNLPCRYACQLWWGPYRAINWSLSHRSRCLCSLADILCSADIYKDPNNIKQHWLMLCRRGNVAGQLEKDNICQEICIVSKTDRGYCKQKWLRRNKNKQRKL